LRIWKFEDLRMMELLIPFGYCGAGLVWRIEQLGWRTARAWWVWLPWANAHGYSCLTASRFTLK